MSSASAESPDPAAGPPGAGGGGSGATVPLPPRASARVSAVTAVPGGRASEDVAPDWSAPVWAEPTEEESEAAARGAGRMWRWVFVVASCLLVLVVVAGEMVGRRYLTAEVESRLRDSGMTGVIDVSVGGGWRPVVLPAVIGTGLDRLTIRITNGTVGGLPVRRADYDLRGIEGDVSLRNGTVRVRSIASGDVRIAIDPAALETVTGTTMRIRGGRLLAGEEGVPVGLKVRGDLLVLGGEAEGLWGTEIEIPVVDDQLLPCTPRVRVVDRSIVLACRGRSVPGILVDPLEGDRSPTAPAGQLVPPQSTILGGTGDGTDVGPPTSDTTLPETTIPDTTVPVTTIPQATVAPETLPPPETVPTA